MVNERILKVYFSVAPPAVFQASMPPLRTLKLV